MQSEEFEALSKKIDSLISLNAQIAAQGRKALLDAEGIFTFNAFGETIRMYLPDVAQDVIQGLIATTGSFFEMNHLTGVYRDKLIPAGGTVLDIGCNIGNHSLFFAKVMKVAKVIAFDPQPHCQRIFERNVQENNLTGVRFELMGLGRATAKMQITRFDPNNYGATRFELSDGGTFEVQSLDAYCAKAKLKTIDFIKIDVEGMALEVIAGAHKTLDKFKPPMWIELIPRFGEVAPATEALKGIGYELAYRFGRTDYLFHHKDNKITAAPQ